MDNRKFDEYYNKLNAKQKEAVDSIEGPVMVVAGPGTGKTQILTLRIANILRKTDMEPSAILALTFTESGVLAMRKRLAEIIGSSAYEVSISTFHGFCNDIIKNYPEEFPAIAGFDPITEIEQAKLMEDVISSSNLDILKPFGSKYHYLKPAITAIKELKREGLSPEDFNNLVDEEIKDFDMIEDLKHEKGPHKGKVKGQYLKLRKNIDKNAELALIYKNYQTLISNRKYYDYEDMIMEVLKTISKKEDFLRILQEQYQYILVDEHQDTNNAQNKVVELLANYHDNPNVFIVGDQKQAIYRFQGASIKNFNYFKTKYPEAKVVNLEHNYRSSQIILDAAHGIKASEINLKSNSGHKDKNIKLAELSSPDQECAFIAEDIKKEVEEGVKPDNIAVLVRENRDMWPIAEMLGRFGVPYVMETEHNLLEDEDIKRVLFLLEAVNNYGDTGALLETMHLDFLGIEPINIYKISDFSRRNKINAYEVASSEKLLKEAGVADKKPSIDFLNKLSKWKTVSKNKTLPELFESVLYESNLIKNTAAQPDYYERISKMSSFFNYIKELSARDKKLNLEKFLGYIDSLKEHNIRLGTSNLLHGGSNVRILTAHRSKGREFEHLYIANAQDRHWGNKRKANILKLLDSVYLGKNYKEGFEMEVSSDDDDERNLFYVALTRAMKTITISYALNDGTGKDKLPSKFVREINGGFISRIDNPVSESIKPEAISDLILRPRPPIRSKIEDKEFLKDLFHRKGISVTALNNYLKCPWRYFYVNLVGIPQVKNLHQIYGTAVHEGLKSVFGKGDVLLKDKLINKFKETLSKESIGEDDFNSLLSKGELALGGYYDFYHEKWNKNVMTELRIKGIELEPNIMINGQLDKVEFIDDGNRVNVVDYKTGKPKSRNYIIGKTTATGAGDYKRQLVFYKLLLDNYSGGKYDMVSGEIDFVEPDEKKRYKKELFTVEPSEVKELKDLVLEKSNEILELSFWDKRCDDKECKFCELRNLMA
ncbi:MAG: hypothetical protein COV29_03065 [Candidatus Yanofskybacteria bacterium CG10_big_fil_rev_8_21_14_0_10_36_16]|uniref:DNA 3'-5' helicase n=1 Tax=Candidatus Yanofskybacteria bacterium CG10_big_fil_rev_8_21_14_0_10_36_16 TaxID=1975096 RepID=A0A2J0Q6W0_9BACT|nr:MAG: hypothetical protein COV29_03065 [Candidatus Yanofskybacteria bacterium CG10_big_fil_rev_8_21_14_0_10_36_16]